MTDTTPLDSLEEKRLATPRMVTVTTLFLFVALVGITAGVYAIMIGHHYAFGISREVPWGIVISSFAFFATISTGLCLLSALGHQFGVRPLAPLTNRATYLAIVAIVTGFMLFAAGVEKPWRLFMFNATSPNLTSNIWWLCTLYGIMSGCLFLRFSFFVTQRQGMALGVGIIAAVAGVGANNNLGGLFTIAADPPIWYGSQLLILFLTSSVMSGTAVIIIFTKLAYKIRNEKLPGNIAEALQSGGTILAMTLLILLVITIARFTSVFSSTDPEPGRLAAIVLLKGPLAFNFWFMEMVVGIVVPLVVLLVTKIKNPSAMIIAAAMALTGGFFQRYDLVVSGQIVPKYAEWQGSLLHHYIPSLTEFFIVVGAFGLLGGGFLLGERFIGRIFSYR